MSNLINKTGLKKFADGFWTKIKGRYDNAFVGAEITANTETEKKIKFTKAGGGDKVDVSLADYARLQDRNAFKKDVSVDDAETKNNASIGEKTRTVDPSLRSFGARNLSSSLFTDRYVSKFRVYLENNSSQQQVAVHVWAIKKGATKREDTTARDRLHRGTTIPVSSGNGKKWIDIPINATFEHDTYFIFRTGSSVNVEAISSIKQENADHVVNLNVNTPLDAVGQPLDLSDQIEHTTAYVEIFGRIGIVDLNKKIEKVSADSSLYVKQDEVSITSEANKVVRLGADGKLDKDMLPSIAINKYFEITDFTNPALQSQIYENGDVAVVTGNGANRGKRYLCINKVEGQPNSINDFIELNSKDGSVLSVNDKTGAVELSLEATDDKFKLKISGTGGEAVKEIPMISEQDITDILDSLPQ